jgi:DNA-binding MarR family transcriptional regulator
MDAVFFEVKRAHLAGARACGRALKPFALTPARFDLMNAIATLGRARQSDLWRMLGVVRSVVSEMLGALAQLGWVKRVRAADARTWLVMLTRSGRAVFERAYERWVASGDVGVRVDAALVDRDFERDPEEVRIGLIMNASKLIQEFGWFRRGAPDLYLWDPEDYYFLFADPDLPGVSFDVPFVE